MDESEEQKQRAFEIDFKMRFPRGTEVVVHHGAEFPLPSSIERGVVYVLANWSGPALVSLRKLMAMLETVDATGFQVHVFNTDFMSAQFINAYGKFPSSGGWGECFWIKNGKVIYSDGGYYREDADELIAARAAEFFPQD